MARLFVAHNRFNLIELEVKIFVATFGVPLLLLFLFRNSLDFLDFELLGGFF